MTAREALRLLHLDDGCSQDEVRRAYLDMVKVWHPDRFESDAQLRSKAERTLQSINEAYAVLQGHTWDPGPDPAGGRGATESQGASHADTGSRAEPAAPPRVPRPARLPRHLVAAAGIGAAGGVFIAIMAILRSDPEPIPDPAPTEASTSPSPADITPNTARPPSAPAGARPAAARPESGSELRAPRGTGTGQVAARNQTAWDSAVLLDGPPGARAFFLRRGEQVTLLDVPPGTYRVRVMLGAEWTGRGFARGAAFYQREESATIVGRQDSEGGGAHLILIDNRAGMRPVPAFRFD